MRNQKGIAALVAVAVIALGACTILSPTEVNQGQQVIIGQPPASPSPSPSASPSPAAAADFDNIGIFAFGYDNEPAQACAAPPDGQRQNSAGQYIVPPGCRLALTATAFKGTAQVHLPDSTAITWRISGAGALAPRTGETNFNRNYTRTGAGLATVDVTIGSVTGSRGFVNQ